jgi:hypothetical protein
MADADITYWNQLHIDQNGWCCFGAHFCCRKQVNPDNLNLSIVQVGRPISKIGAQAYGINSISIGCETNGDFTKELPSEIQINALVALIAACAIKLPIDHIIGHEDVFNLTGDASTATACPGNYLYERIPEIAKRVSDHLNRKINDPYTNFTAIKEHFDANHDPAFERTLGEQGLWHK